MVDKLENMPATKADIFKLAQLIFDLSMSIRASSLAATNPDDEQFINDTRELVKMVSTRSHELLMAMSKGEA